ncbi:MAG: glycosyltransferase family 4 protein [Candidatus Eisenbacteria bacterium]
MKVLLVSLEYPPYTFGGVGSHVFRLSRALVREGIEVAVLSPGPSRGEQSSEDGVRRFTVPVGEVPGVRLLSLAFRVPSAVRSVRKEFPFDLIHSHFGPCAFLGRREIRGTPLVETAHGTHLGELQALAPLGRLLPREIAGKYTVYPLLSILDLLSYAKASLIIAVSELAREEIARYGKGLLKKVVVVPNGIELSEFPLEVSPRIGAQDRVDCLAVAFMQARKGLDYLVEAAGHLKDQNIRITVVGDGPHFLRLKSRTERLALTDKIAFTGRLDRAEVRERFRSAQMFVLPSLWEGQGIVFLEAMASGLPIVATDIPGVRGMLRDGENALLVPPRDSRSLALAIEKLASSPALRLKLASEGLARVREYDWNHLVKRIVSLYSSLLKGKKDEKQSSRPVDAHEISLRMRKNNS